MKKPLSTKTMGVFIAIFILTACVGALPQPPTPTATITPTASPTLTLSPTPAPVLLGTYPILSPEDMRYDLNELFHRIEATHPNPYAKRSKAEVDIDRQRIYEELYQPMTVIEFYKKVAPVVTSLEDYHTILFLSQDVKLTMFNSELIFPFAVQTEGEHAYITVNVSDNDAIQVGSELLEVNGVPIDTIKELEKQYFHGVDNIDSSTFLFLFGSPAQYQVKVILPGKTTSDTFEVPSISGEQLQQRASSSQAPTPQPWEPVKYTSLPDEKIGILTLNTFEEIGPLLKPIFVQIQKDGIQDLILDIRSNNGGKYGVIDALMDFLTDQPYKRCSRMYEAPFKGYGSGAPRELKCEPIQPFDIPERYKGNLYLLIGPETFSAAITFATMLQDAGLATLIGEKTTDTASYCAKVPKELTPLPRTKLLYRVAKTCYVRPSGVLDDQPVIPDILVETTLQDQIAGKDPVLDYTVKMIRNGGQNP